VFQAFCQLKSDGLLTRHPSAVASRTFAISFGHPLAEEFPRSTRVLVTSSSPATENDVLAKKSGEGRRIGASRQLRLAALGCHCAD
jgi:hypothetical protein